MTNCNFPNFLDIRFGALQSLLLGSLNPPIYDSFQVSADITGATLYVGGAVHGYYFKLKDGTQIGTGSTEGTGTTVAYPDHCFLSNVLGHSHIEWGWIHYFELIWDCK